MSDPLKHECGIAIVRLKKSLDYYRQQYGTPMWGLNKLYLLMEKQRNRGQDGVGVGVCQQDTEAGSQYMMRERHPGSGSLDILWNRIHSAFDGVDLNGDIDELRRQVPWLGDVMMGHLRYGTHGGNDDDVCHPFHRFSNWPTRRLLVAGNFNLTNTPELFDMLVHLGQHPVGGADTNIVMEKIGHFLDVANDALIRRGKAEGISGPPLLEKVAAELDMARVLRHAAKHWDGGYMMSGIVGHGSCFVLRDPGGIRPGWYYEDDEVIAVASERVALVTCFNVESSQVAEVPPGHALLIDQAANLRVAEVCKPAPRTACTFERIYFSRGNDEAIYEERKALGRELVPSVLAAIDQDVRNTVFSYVPNTAEISYYGLIEGMHDYLGDYRKQAILSAQRDGSLSEGVLEGILDARIRSEKVVLKDAKLRTFISDESGRGDLVRHAYDITRSTVRSGEDSLVVLDDSIVRGTTLRESILSMLARLHPRKIVVVSSAPQIRYPDCYGIDMSQLGKFIAFEAAVSLLTDSGREHVLQECYEASKRALADQESVNCVQPIYESFSNDEISARISQLVRPSGVSWQGEIEVIYQSVEGLRNAIPHSTGDWYFTGNFPTPGGFRVVNRAFINYMDGNNSRAY